MKTFKHLAGSAVLIATLFAGANLPAQEGDGGVNAQGRATTTERADRDDGFDTGWLGLLGLLGLAGLMRKKDHSDRTPGNRH